MYLYGRILDDVMRRVIEEVLERGTQISPTKGPAWELTGVLLELRNPRARLSLTVTRGRPYSCLGELCWYLAKRNDVEFISYYIPAYRDYANGNKIYGGYGPRLFEWKGIDQVENIKRILHRKPYTRQAVIQLFDANDIANPHNDVPCTCTLQFMVRDDKLQMFTNMRSNDVYWGLPHDIFSFTMLQELVARNLSIEMGTYKHAVGSLHLYDKDIDTAKKFLDEGWQSTKTPMPSMPSDNPQPALELFLKAESEIRKAGKFDAGKLISIDSYWMDLILLLQVFRHWKYRQRDQILRIRRKISSKVYLPFIDAKLEQLEEQTESHR